MFPAAKQAKAVSASSERQWRSRGRLVVKSAEQRALRTEDSALRHPRLRHRPGGSPRHKPKLGLTVNFTPTKRQRRTRQRGRQYQRMPRNDPDNDNQPHLHQYLGRRGYAERMANAMLEKVKVDRESRAGHRSTDSGVSVFQLVEILVIEGITVWLEDVDVLFLQRLGWFVLAVQLAQYASSPAAPCSDRGDDAVDLHDHLGRLSVHTKSSRPRLPANSRVVSALFVVAVFELIRRCNQPRLTAKLEAMDLETRAANCDGTIDDLITDSMLVGIYKREEDE